MIVDCDLRDSDVEDDFFLGPIVAISDASLAIHAVSATAEWYDEIDRVPYKEITDFRFGDHYSLAYLKYVPTTILKGGDLLDALAEARRTGFVVDHVCDY